MARARSGRALVPLVLGSVFFLLAKRLTETARVPHLERESERLSADALPAAPPLPSGPPLPNSTAAVASYTWLVRFDADAHTASARGTIRWRNASRLPVSELWFHLYLNAFEHDRTLFLSSPFGAGRSRHALRDYGHTDVKRLVWREGGGVEDLWPAAAPHAPGFPQDRTNYRLPLPRPVEPGESVTLDVEFESRLPGLLERTGYFGGFHFFGQWFPKLARLESDGTWAHFPFHPNAEFYADFGDYDITLDVPPGVVVGATGKRVEERQEEGRQRLRYQARSVHDFAWTAWSEFEEATERVGSVELRVLFPPGQRGNADATLRVLREALPRLEAWLGAYPWPALTIVHPPRGAESAGGMEYPTLITTGGPWFVHRVGRALETVTIHELAHQWFQGLVATHEPKWPFLDEGLTTAVEATLVRELYGDGSALRVGEWAVSADALRRVHAARAAQAGPITRHAAEFADFDEIGRVVYARTGTLWRTFENVHGSESMREVLARFARRFRFAHPGPADFFAVAREVLGATAGAALERAFTGAAWVNYRADALHCRPTLIPGGRLPASARSLPEEPEVVGAAPSAPTSHLPRMEPRELRPAEPPEPATTTCTARFVREGPLAFPVRIELWDAAGTRHERSWTGETTFIVLEHVGESPILSAVIDPAHAILLDTDLLDNAIGTPRPHPRWSWLHATFVSGLVLGTAGP
jgi:hypothetical protein